MISRKTKLKRFTKYYNYLISDKAIHDQWNFKYVVREIESLFRSRRSCGCALGELPGVWPHVFALSLDREEIIHVRSKARLTFIRIREFLSISASEESHLFYPRQQNPSKFGGIWLDSDASRDQVAENMYQFIKVTEKFDLKTQEEL